MPASSGALRLSLLYAVVFTEIGIAMPFLPVWLATLDLDAGVIGLLLALPIATRIVATAPLMGLIDRGLGARRLIVAGSFGVAVTYGIMAPASSLGWPALAVLTVLNAVAAAPLVPSIDYLTLSAARRDARLTYSRIRMAGSIAFLAANLAGGVLLAALGGKLAVPILLTGLALIACLTASLDRTPAEAPRRAAGGPSPRLPRRLWLCILAAASIQAGHAAVYGFGSIYWTAHGLSATEVGALWAIGVLAEIILFALAPRLPASWRGPVPLLVLGGAAGILRAAGSVPRRRPDRDPRAAPDAARAHLRRHPTRCDGGGLEPRAGGRARPGAGHPLGGECGNRGERDASKRARLPGGGAIGLPRHGAALRPRRRPGCGGRAGADASKKRSTVISS